MLLKIIVRILNLGRVDMGGGDGGKEHKPLWGNYTLLDSVQFNPCWYPCHTFASPFQSTSIDEEFSTCRLHGLNTALYIQVYVVDDHVLCSCTPVCTLALLELCTFAITCSVRVCSKLIVSTFLWNSILILSLS